MPAGGTNFDPTPGLPPVAENISINNTQYNISTWKAGDTVTSAKLNNIEQGIANAGGALVVNANIDGELDKTWQEIYDGNYYFIINKGTFNNNKYKYIGIILAVYNEDIYIIQVGVLGEDEFVIESYTTDNANSYPQLVTGVEE